MRRTLLVLGASVLAVCAADLGAREKPRTGAQILEEAAGAEVDPVTFRTQVRSLARPFSGIIESAADRILFSAQSDQERILALRLKINGIPTIQGALFISDPLAASFEAAAFLEQLRIFLEEGQGTVLPELVRSEALVAVEDMKQRIRDLGAAHGVREDAGLRFWQRAEEWARQHPITTSVAARDTTQVIYAEHIATAGRGLRGLATRLEEDVKDLSIRFDLYAEYIAKQTRWQAELLVEEGLAQGLPRRMVQATGSVPINITDLPVDAAAERAAILEFLEVERALFFAWAEEQRLATQEFVRNERGALATTVASERAAAFAAVTEERQAVLDALDAQRIELMAELPAALGATGHEVGRQLIDHAALRLAQLLAATVLAMFLGAAVLVFIRTRGDS